MAGKIRRDNLRSLWLHRLLDIGLNWLAMTLAYAVKEGFQIGIPTESVTGGIVLHTFAVVALIWLIVCTMLEVYRYKRRLFHEIATLIVALALTIAFLNTYVYFARPFENFVYPRYGIVFYGLIGSFLLGASRAIKNAIRRSLHRRGIGVRRVIIIGIGPVADRLAAAFREAPALGYEFRGFVTLTDTEPVTKNQLGALDQLEEIIASENVDEVIVTLPGDKHQEILNIAYRCQAENIRLRVVPDLFEVIMIRATMSEIDDIPLIGLRDPVIIGYQSFTKRVFDLISASICLAFSSPLFVLIPIVIRLNSRGPIFFKQIRVGENGRHFAMYKFRSMILDAEKKLKDLVDIEQLDEPVFKIRNDPRVTGVGRFLRRTSLDELPQLINVLKGDMSMVGPRPEELQVVRQYQLWHRKRLSVKPGITGPMQVSGRGELSLDERINLEIMYISRYSIIEDVKYLFKTIPAVCRARGAY